MRRVVVSAIVATIVAGAVPAGAGAGSSDPQVLCGNFGGQTMDPHHARKPARCDVTGLRGLPGIYELRHMRWATWSERPVGRGLVDGTQRTIRLKKTRPCGLNGEIQAYSKMSIDGRPFRSILYCGD